jgi:predicted nucleotidyltransferase
LEYAVLTRRELQNLNFQIHLTFMSVSFDKKRLARLCREHGAIYAGLFGSWARGEATRDSDVDILVRFEARQSLVDLARIEREISEELGQSVDLVTENVLSPSLRDRVMQDLEVIVGEDSVRL